MAKRFGKIAIATTTFALATLVSIDWAEQGGVSLSIESAQARVGRPLTPVSVAGVGRRQYRRAAYGYGYGAGAVGVGLAAGAVTAAAVAATSPWGYQSRLTTRTPMTHTRAGPAITPTAHGATTIARSPSAMSVNPSRNLGGTVPLGAI